MRKFYLLLFAATIVSSLIVWFARNHTELNAQAAAPAPAIPVTATPAKVQDVPVYLRDLVPCWRSTRSRSRRRSTGCSSPSTCTNIVAQIDPRLYQAALDQATAQRAEDAAQLQSAQLDLQRFQHLAKSQFAPIATAIAQHGDRVKTAIGQRMMDQRRFYLGKGVAYRGATFERRLAVVIDMADRLHNGMLADLITPLFDRLFEEWVSDNPEINDAVSFLRVMDGTQSMAADVAEERKTVIRSELLTEIKTVVAPTSCARSSRSSVGLTKQTLL